MRMYTVILAVRSCRTTGLAELPGFEFLMVKNRKRGGLWELPGGRGEPGETPEDCARREFLEETGRELREPRLLLRREGLLGDGHIFLGTTTSETAGSFAFETEAAAWFRRLPATAELSFPGDPYAQTFAAARAVLGPPAAGRPAGR